jgi:hypothetical protein
MDYLVFISEGIVLVQYTSREIRIIKVIGGKIVVTIIAR